MTRTPGKLLDVEPAPQQQAMWCWAACTEAVLRYLRKSDDLARCRQRGFIAEFDMPVPSQGQMANLRRGADGKPHIDCSVPPGPEATDAEEDEWYRVCNWGGWPVFMEFSDVAQSTEWGSHRYTLETRGLAMEEGAPRLRPKLGRKLTSEELYYLVHGGGSAFKRALDNAEDCALSWQMLKRQLDDDSPVVFSWRYDKPGSGHVMIAAGYVSTPRRPARNGSPAVEAQNWVVVYDSLPPKSGDAYLVTYDYYVGGPYGRHWRDYWIPKTEFGRRGAAPSEDALGVPEQLTASPGLYVRDPAGDGWRLDPTRGLDDDFTALLRSVGSAARPAAEQGLAALQAIVSGSDAQEVAVVLGMGASLLKLISRQMLSAVRHALSESAEVTTLEPSGQVDPALLLGPPDKSLEFFVDPQDPSRPLVVPLFEILRDDLLRWDPQDPASESPQLGAPAELIWPIRWPRQRPFELFSTVTVRPGRDHQWTPTSVGRVSLVLALAVERWFDRLERVGPVKALTDQPLTAGKILDFLIDWQLLGPIWQALSALDPALIAQTAAEDSAGDERWIKSLQEEAGLKEGDEAEKKRVRALVEAVLARARQLFALLEKNAKGGAPLPPDDDDLEALRKLAAAVDELWSYFRTDDQEPAAAGAKAESQAPILRDHLPVFLIEVKELYQLFAAYRKEPGSDEFEIKQIYGQEFYARPHRVDPRDRQTLLEQLRRLAERSRDRPPTPSGST